MAAPRRKPWIWFAVALLLPSSIASAQVGPDRVDNIKGVFERLRTCWKPPPAASHANPEMDITVIVSFNRDGNINGHPKITYESEQATDNDRLAYRIAVMETLQRCTPMPFTEGMAGAIAGRPFAVRFQNRKPPPQPTEKRAWLTPKIL
ncbi:MAG: hypothetical protein JWP25_2465 [Bradyrhizobium sp.]|jgi:hypothetical protein|nr:hypothetical protein [Bradyrhizobium sp.]MEA2865687.1 hypothetical protein [Bradyrhizobium sp.]